MKRIRNAMGIVLVISILVFKGKSEEEYSSITSISNGGVVSAYENGVDVKEKRKELEVQVMKKISQELAVDRSLKSFVCWRIEG